MKIKIQKWGNSLAVRIPKAFARETEIHENEFVNLSIQENKIVIEPVEQNDYSLDDLVSGINKNNLHGEVNSGKNVGNEVW
jgi:antitoxin MazE